MTKVKYLPSAASFFGPTCFFPFFNNLLHPGEWWFCWTTKQGTYVWNYWANVPSQWSLCLLNAREQHHPPVKGRKVSSMLDGKRPQHYLDTCKACLSTNENRQLELSPYAFGGWMHFLSAGKARLTRTGWRCGVLLQPHVRSLVWGIGVERTITSTNHWSSWPKMAN